MEDLVFVAVFVVILLTYPVTVCLPCSALWGGQEVCCVPARRILWSVFSLSNKLLGLCFPL